MEFLEELIKDSKGPTKLVTIAPEVNGAIDCIKALKDKISFSVGHTIANYNEAKLAFDMGANHVTHLYNAMTGLTHREPGVVGAAAENERVMAEMILMAYTFILRQLRQHLRCLEMTELFL